MTLERATANVRHRCKARYRHRGGQRQPGATADRRAGADGRLSAAPVRGRSALVPLHPGVTGQPTCASFVPIRSVLEFARAQAVTGPECLARPAGNCSCRWPRALERRLGQLQVHLDQTLRRNRTRGAASPTLPTSAAGMTAGHAQRCGADLARPPALRSKLCIPPKAAAAWPQRHRGCGDKKQVPNHQSHPPKPQAGRWTWIHVLEQVRNLAMGPVARPPVTAPGNPQREWMCRHHRPRICQVVEGARSNGADQAQEDCSVEQSRWTGLTRTGQYRPT